MLILGSCGFSYPQNRLKIGELIQDQSGKMLIIPLACMFGTETGEKEKNCAAMLNFKRENIYVFDDSKPDALGLKNKLCNRINHQKMTKIKMQPKRATLRIDSTQAVR